MNRRVLVWIAAGVLGFLRISVLAHSPSTTTQHLASATVSVGFVWALRSVFRTRRLFQVLVEGALHGTSVGWFWAATRLKPQLPVLTDWTALTLTLTPSLTLGLAVAPMVLGIAYRIYCEIRQAGTI